MRNGNGLLARMERSKTVGTRGLMQQYAKLLGQGDDAPEGAEDQLTELSRALGFSLDDVRRHVAAIAQDQHLAQLIARGGGVAIGRTSERGDLRRDFPFLFLRPDGEPEAIEVRMYGECPRTLDTRLLNIDRAEVFSANTLEREYGLAVKTLQDASLPNIGGEGGDQRFYGASVYAWARQVAASMRTRRRKELDEQITELVGNWAELLQANELCTLPLLRRCGIGQEHLPGMRPATTLGTYRNVDIVQWVRGEVLPRNARAKTELKTLDKQDKIYAVGVIPEPAA